jgi:hypothetical protein
LVEIDPRVGCPAREYACDRVMYLCEIACHTWTVAQLAAEKKYGVEAAGCVNLCLSRVLVLRVIS